MIEPLDAVDPDGVPASGPVVVDARGRMWRMRYQPTWSRAVTRAAPVIVGLVLLALLLVLHV